MVSIESGKKDVAIDLDFFKFLKKKQEWNEPSLEDTMRRLTKFKPRKERK